MPLSRQLLFVDLSSGNSQSVPIPPEVRRGFLGGRGLNMLLLYRLGLRCHDPFSPDNPLIFGAGLLTGVLGGRLNISARSPESGLLGDANVGGDFGAELAATGYSHLLIAGKSDKPVYLLVTEDGVQIRDAGYLWGRDTLETQRMIRRELADQEVRVACIGPAGENLVRFAGVVTGQKNIAGRTGMGAVMGSKNLKAVAVKGSNCFKISDPEGYLEALEEVVRQVSSTRWGQALGKMGTPLLLHYSNAMGFLSVRYHRRTTLGEQGRLLEPSALEEFSTGMLACYGCPVHCRHRYTIGPGSRYAGATGEGPEYASVASLGSHVGNLNIEAVIYMAQLCNRYGLDTISTGNYLAWAMDLYERGILTNGDTGVPLEWGNEDSLIQMLHMIANRRGFGNVLAEGSRAAAELGPEAARHLLQIKGVSMELTDERPVKSFALGLATATRGCCHMRSRPSVDVTNLPREILASLYGGDVGRDYTDYKGKGRMVWWHELFHAVTDAIGYCRFLSIFTSIHAVGYQEYARLIHRATGLELDAGELQEIGERIYTTERMFLTQQGISRKDDTLPDLYFEVPVPEGPSRGEVVSRAGFQAMLDEYYQLHGWDKNGIPRAETVSRLGLEEFLGGGWPCVSA